jgi:MFS family permease
MHGYRRDLALLRDRRFALLLFARTMSLLGGAFAPVALAFGVLRLPGATASTLSIVLAAESVPLVAFMLFAGVLADRFRRNRVIMAGEIMNALAFAALALMLFHGSPPVYLLVIAAAVSGLGFAVLWPAVTGIIPQVAPPDRLQAANALIGFGGNTARVIGFVAGGATVVLLGGAWALVVSALMFASAAVAIGGLRGLDRPTPESHSVIKDLREGWREFASRQWLWVVVLQFSVLVMAFQAAHGVLGPVVAQEELGGAGPWSAILAGDAIGMLIGVFFAMRVRPKRPILVCVVLTIPASLPYLLLGVGAPLWTVVAGAVAQGICFDVFGALWQTTLQREVPGEALSRVSSYDALGSLMFGPIGLLLAGPASVAFGARPALVGCAVIMTATALVALAAPGVWRLRAPVSVA